MLCQVGELEMRWRGREWCVMSGGRARDEMEGVVCYVRWECLR